MFLFYNEYRPKRKLDNVLQMARKFIQKSDIKDVRKNPVYSLIRAMSNYQLYDIVRELCENEEVPFVDSILKEIGMDFSSSYNHDNSKEGLEEKNIYIDLSRDAVLVCAWDQERLVDALLNIGEDVGNSFKYDEINHRTIYIYPIGLTIVYNGNHSILTGILKGEGTIKTNQTYDFASTYEYVYFDGIYFRNKKDNKVLYKVKRFELGALYEIGRILAENGIR